ncbi:BIR protein [Plasmodium berghei]|uniref:BIR protein n=2 Tax=Plasmodium berghei TaxID=5821 RepID=A0A509AFC0_PLABA|nr:BIR protein [Plasmodium berghei ANKA]CXH20715.1 BIR protein [Plasmodium berghei]SBW38324.1 BIR protein [Plasmodium berghei]SCL86240.1 BIR protein [Plasmodium berghei]SCL86367.1 BIR protein [Plasmodium berghei]VUC54671.1 BIR protein [Plasmodium berghei ANKA]|eukprot:XP_034420498.1 BIR protein [Plasmodium berghei ANKA]
MNKEVCNNFIYVTTKFPDQLDSDRKYYFNDDQHFKEYCDNNKCDSDLEKVNAGCLYFFNAFFKDSSVFESVAKSNIDIVDYIILWLNYMLNLKSNQAKNSLNHFYTTFINNERYKNTINYIEGYNNYKVLIDKKHDLTSKDMDNNIISELYDAFKLLCEMYSTFGESTSNCTKYSEKAKQFVEKYKNLNENSNNTEGTSYNKILSTLSTDYNNLKNKCSNIASFPEINTSTNTAKITKQTSEQTVQNSAQTSEVASLSSSIGNKLIPVLSIFGAIAFFLGIGYKYSLFKSRKQSRKQHLREKLKNKEENGSLIYDLKSSDYFRNNNND